MPHEQSAAVSGPVVEIINQLINDPKLADDIRSKLSGVVDVETVEADIAKIEKGAEADTGK